MEEILARILARATRLLEDAQDTHLEDDERSLARAHAEATTSRGTTKFAPHDGLDGHVLLPTR